MSKSPTVSPPGFSLEKLKKPLETCVSSGFTMVAEEGFEPSQTESESVVLPLHNSAICFCGFVNQRILLYAIYRVLSTKTLKIFMKILYKENRNFDDIGSRKSTRQGV